MYLRDLKTGRTWSLGYEPTRKMPDAYEAAPVPVATTTTKSG